MPTMYELTDSYKALLDAAENVDSDLLADTLESIHDAIEDKAEGYATVIRELESESEKLKSEVERLTKRKQTYENNVKRLKANLQRAMESVGSSKIKGRLFTVSIRNNAPHVVMKDENKIPAYLLKVVRTPDKKAIMNLLNADKEVPGATLEQTKSLQIR